MVDLGALFGEDSAFRQLMVWGVGQQVIGAIIAPALDELTQLVNEVATVHQLTPEIAADLVVRGFMQPGDGASVAAKAGVSGGDFALLTKAAGDAPSTTDLVTAYRRQIIPRDSGDPAVPSLVTGIREGRLDNKWIPMVEGLGDLPIGVADAVDAVVESQITRAAGEAIAYRNGINAENFAILYNTRGNPPSPGELMELVRRGEIPVGGTGPDVLSFDQGIAEGATKNKWTASLAKLITVLPPARTVTALERDGSITQDQALAYYRAQGLDQATAEAYVKDASHSRTAAAKQLAKADVLKLYAAKAISEAQATEFLGDLGYTAAEAAYELEIQDLSVVAGRTTKAIAKIGALFMGRRISATQATTALDTLLVPPEQRTELLADWTLERNATVKILTVAEITEAFAYGVFNQAEATAELVAEGYTPLDAWIVLSIKNKAPLDGKPGGTPSPEDRI